MLKNRYYKISVKDKSNDTIFIRVKKDFYTEGISIKDNIVLQGYYDLYKHLCLSLFDNSDLSSTIEQHHGLAGDLNNGVYQVILDEEFIEYEKQFKADVTITEIEDSNSINDIDFFIRDGIKNLNQNNREIYSYFKDRRIAHFKELVESLTSPIHLQSGEKYTPIEDSKLGVTKEDLEEIKEYLDELARPKVNKNGRDEFGKKKRKRQSNNKF